MLNLEGRALGGCRLIRKIGEGGMGEVYLAEQLRVGNRQVAVKVMRPDPITYGDNAAQEARKRFEREVAILGAFTHPNILPIYDSGVEDEYFYIVMQYAAEGSLLDAMRGTSRRKLTLPLDSGATIDIISQVASALQYTHDRNVIHRDVKPANVLTQLSPSGSWQMLLADFGVARGLDNTSQRTQVTGTVTYMAPEQFRSEFTPATDQYALGVMTYQLLAGRPPFEGELGAIMRGHMDEPPPPLRQFNRNVPPDVEAAVMRALAKNPAARFPSVTAYAQALQAAQVAFETPPPIPASVASAASAAASQQPRWTSGEDNKLPQRGGLGRVWMVTLVIALLLAAVAGVSAYTNQRSQSQPAASATATVQAASSQTANAVLTATPPAATPSITASSTTSPGTPEATPALPSGVGAMIFESVAPACDSGATTQWQAGTDAVVHCLGGSQTSLSSAQPGRLACVSATTVQQSNGYLTAMTRDQSGNVVIGFRQGVGASNGSTSNITGYYVAVNVASDQYVVYKVNDAGNVTRIAIGSLATTPTAAFQLGVLFDGTNITPVIDGVMLPTVHDSDYQTGWIATCADGSATFSDVQLYGYGAA